ncbi:MAG: hypothetical protein ACM3PY_16695 [Omnitrophica WOR_2 bacterium]
MRRKWVFLFLFFLAACNSPSLPKQTTQPGIDTRSATITARKTVLQQVKTLQPVTALPQTRMPSPTSSPIPAAPTSITETATSTASLPAIWNVCPPADRTVKGQELAITSIYMQTASAGWAIDVKGHILHTHDGGKAWQNVTPPAGRYARSGFFVMDELSAWAAPDESCTCTAASCTPSVSHGMLLSTIDGGKTWLESQPFPLALGSWEYKVPYFTPVNLDFVDEQHGWLLAAVYHQDDNRWLELFKTTDGGQTWEKVADHVNTLSMPIAQEIAFLDAQTGWLAVDRTGLASFKGGSLESGFSHPQEILGLLKTTDAGRTWKTQPMPLPQGMDKLKDINLSGEMKCGVSRVQSWPPKTVSVKTVCLVTAGQFKLEYHDMFFSADGGETWKDWIDGVSVDYLTANLAFTLSDSRNGLYSLVRTEDAWQTWTWIHEVSWHGDLNFADEQHGWVVASQNNESALVYTADGGYSWQVLKPQIGS